MCSLGDTIQGPAHKRCRRANSRGTTPCILACAGSSPPANRPRLPEAGPPHRQVHDHHHVTEHDRGVHHRTGQVASQPYCFRREQRARQSGVMSHHRHPGSVQFSSCVEDKPRSSCSSRTIRTSESRSRNSSSRRASVSKPRATASRVSTSFARALSRAPCSWTAGCRGWTALACSQR